jgi:small-conductance mechanosensitive channel
MIYVQTELVYMGVICIAALSVFSCAGLNLLSCAGLNVRSFID